VPEFTINAAEIVELIEAVNENAAPPPNVPTPVVSIPMPKTFEDPAILSVGRKPTPVIRPPIPGPQWSSTSMERVDSARTARGREDRALKDITPTTTLVEPLQHIVLAEVEANDAAIGLGLEELEAAAEISLEQPVAKHGRRARRRKHGRKAGEESLQEPDVTPAKETTRSKGWRQTPLLEPNPSFQPFATLKRQKGRGKGRVDENGWATEDATDVQDMGDFDFIGSLAKFDKHSVFEKIQAEDSIAEEDRLVSHNRLPKVKPGTAGGKNLHYTENVLDVPNGNGTPKTKAELWKSEAGESDLEERTSMRDTGSGRQSRRAESKLATNRRPPSRKGSSIASAQPVRTHSVSHNLPLLHAQPLTPNRFPLLHRSLLSTSYHLIVAANPSQHSKCLI
jgi:enhancer of mRNA-decapping protein 3